MGFAFVGGLRRSRPGAEGGGAPGLGPARWADGVCSGRRPCHMLSAPGRRGPGCPETSPTRDLPGLKGSGVGNLGKEVLIEDYGLRRVFFFFSFFF